LFFSNFFYHKVVILFKNLTLNLHEQEPSPCRPAAATSMTVIYGLNISHEYVGKMLAI